MSIQGFTVGGPSDLLGRNSALQSGLVSPAQQTALWGGMGVSLAMPGAGLPQSLGPLVSLATSADTLRGFSAFNESDAMTRFSEDEESNSVPLAIGGDGVNPGGALNFVTVGSRARIWVKAEKEMASQFANAPALYWDYSNQLLLAAPASVGDLPIPVTILALNVDNARVVAPGGACWVDGECAALIRI